MKSLHPCGSRHRAQRHLLGLVTALFTITLLASECCRAETLTFTTTGSVIAGRRNQGNWSPTDPHSASNYLYFTGSYGLYGAPYKTYRGHLTFNLSTLNKPVARARLKLTRFSSQGQVTSASNPAGFQRIGVFDVTTDAVTLNTFEGVNAQIFNDLGSGISYGTTDIAQRWAPDEVLILELNQDAVDAINRSRGPFSVGLSLLTADGTADHFIFGNTGGAYNGVQALELITEANRPPVAGSTPVLHPPTVGTPVTIYRVSESVSDPDGDSVSITELSYNGSGSVKTDGQTVTYTNGGFVGTESVTIRVSDVGGASATTTVTLANTAPLAKDIVTRAMDQPQAISVLPHVSDLDGDTVRISAVTNGRTGSVKIEGANVVYSPQSFSGQGQDTFTYTISDSRGGSTTASVALVNQGPVATDDSLHPPANDAGPVRIDVLVNDTDPDSDALRIKSVTNGVYGTIAHDGTGITYTPGADYQGHDQFTYSVTDGHGGNATATVTLNNQLPVAADDELHPPAGAVSSFGIEVLNNDSDRDEGDTLVIVSATNGKFGTVTTDGAKLTYTPGPDYTGNDEFYYTISDRRGTPSSAANATTRARVTLRNAQPLAVDDFVRLARSSVEIPVLANDSDPDGDSSLSIIAFTQGSLGSVAQTGSTLIYSPGPAFRSGDSFTYTVRDEQGARATAKVILMPADMSTDTIFVSGDAVPDEEGSSFLRFGIPSFNASGAVAFTAKYRSKTGSVKSGVFAGLPAALITRNDDAAIGVAGATFAGFKDPVLNDNGDVAFLARLSRSVARADTGIWIQRAGGKLELVAREGAEAPGTQGDRFAGFLSIALPNTGRLVFTATTTQAIGSATAKRTGVWRVDEQGALKLVVREGDTLRLPDGDLVVKSIPSLRASDGSPGQRRGFNQNGELLLRLQFRDLTEALVFVGSDGEIDLLAGGGTITDGGSDGGLWRFSSGCLSDPGTATFRYRLLRDRNTATRSGEWRIAQVSKAGEFEIVASSSAPLTDPPGAVLKSVNEPVSNADGDVAFTGRLQIGAGGVTRTNDLALWTRRHGQEPRLLLREGDEAPGVAGGRFTSFESIVFPSERGVAFSGRFALDGRKVTHGVDTGLWAQDRIGALHLLVREGAAVEIRGKRKIIRSITALSHVPASSSQGHGYSRTGGFIYRAIFADNSQGIFSTWLP